MNFSIRLANDNKEQESRMPISLGTAILVTCKHNQVFLLPPILWACLHPSLLASIIAMSHFVCFYRAPYYRDMNKQSPFLLKRLQYLYNDLYFPFRVMILLCCLGRTQTHDPFASASSVLKFRYLPLCSTKVKI